LVIVFFVVGVGGVFDALVGRGAVAGEDVDDVDPGVVGEGFGEDDEGGADCLEIHMLIHRLLPLNPRKQVHPNHCINIYGQKHETPHIYHPRKCVDKSPVYYA